MSNQLRLAQNSPTFNERVLQPLIEILAYFAANRNYGYIDILSNALDPITAREALINALRDFEATCRRTEETGEVPCPSINPTKLEEAIRLVDSYLDKSGEQLFSFTRSLALRALARAASLKVISERRGEEE